MKFEQNTINRIIAPAFAITLGLAACGDGNESESPTRETKVRTTDNSGDVQIAHTYTPTGERITQFSESDGREDEYTTIIAFCDGADLVEQTSYNRGSYRAGAGNAIVRSVDHPACEDSTLTEDDFNTPG